MAAIKSHGAASRPLRILDAGAGRGGILNWMNMEPRLAESNVILLDINEQWLRFGQWPSVLASGAAMPFRDRGFDIAVSVDSLEHVGLAIRAAYAHELMRVADVVVVHVPADSADGRFAGRQADARFQSWFVRRFGSEEPNTAEHLATERHPDPYTLFPGAAVTPRQPVGLWLTTMIDICSPWRRYLSGFRYLLDTRLRSRRRRPPFHAALITWTREP
ncbi:MAG: class I SAM-dependent methyltransferase [Chloroflexi bacterium]|nr:class I SAM-dependent methyltransferase [Chloroflexota bacterium]